MSKTSPPHSSTSQTPPAAFASKQRAILWIFRICRDFARRGTCSFKNCKRDDDRPKRDTRPKRPELSDSEKQFRSWKDTITTDIRASRPDARQFIEVDAGLMQGTGLEHIRDLSKAKEAVFRSQVLPLLETVSHPKVLSSLILEQAVGTIFNVLAALFLSSICDEETAVEWLEISLLVFAKIVDLNSTAFQLFLQMTEGGLASSLHHSRNLLDHLLRRLEIGSFLPSAPANDKLKSFTVHREPPGGRHDNDHADIIQSSRIEYLPVNDPGQWHVGGLDGLEDTIGQLRDAIHQELKGSQGPGGRISQVRTHIYFDKFLGFQFKVQFPQPPHDRENWWQLSKRLQPGALVTVVFFRSPEKQTNAASLWGDAKEASVKMTLVDTKPGMALNKRDFSVVEFPGILLAGFEPTLRALKKIKENRELPFLEILVPNGDVGPVEVPPPLYALRPGFRFNLRCLMNNKAELYIQADKPVDIEYLQRNSTLDGAQARALVNSLQHRIGLIQGPPGTGKSYTGVALIRVLLANKKQGKTNLGPVLCVTYTNHALDQLLEALIDKGVTSQIIRIGSQSKSDQLRSLNLRHIAKDAEKTKRERQDQYRLHCETEACEDKFSTLNINQGLLATHLIPHLQKLYPRYYSALFGKDEDGWERVGHGKPSDVIRRWVQAGGPGDEIRSFDVLMSLNPSQLSQKEREELRQIWAKEVIKLVHDKVTQLCSAHRIAKANLDNVRDEVDLRCLADADVIGVTTSGLARNLNMLRKLQSKVVMCEEAGEVLEAHLLTALLPSVEHAILIGDHLQLRPQVQNYELSRENPRGGEKYSLDVSLFERLVESQSAMGLGLPFSTLETQRRMHPSIAQLVRNTLYPQLEDAESVSSYPEVVGMRRRLFWLDHREPEADAANTSLLATSHWNEYEIQMTMAVVNHLVRQGKYHSGDIAVITPYLGQLHRLRQLFSQHFTVTLGERDADQLESAGFEAGETDVKTTARATLLQTLRVATIDNFQGEEAKVVVISLVRSNSRNRCGFLRTSNRINVLLSRAQHGMYIIGNSETCTYVPMWAQVIDILRQSGNIGSQLELQCPRHPDTPLLVSTPHHFLQLSPEGQKCHSELLHNAAYCPQPCPRPRKGCTHPCVKRCGDPCPDRCMVKVYKEDRKLECGHSMPTLPCWQDQDLSTVRCKVAVAKTVERCKHEITVECHQDVKLATFKCTAQCNALLTCGHTCKRPCHHCVQLLDWEDVRIDHGRCQQKCGRKHSTCAHFCSAVCHGDEPCPPCGEPCDVQCGHSKCTKKCREPCTPCAEERCFSRCPHSACTMPCAAPCNHIPCSKRCDQKLQCGHQCPSLCGERCPSDKYCQTCASKGIKHQVVDFILGETYENINLDENPCIFPRCGHFLTMESMDGQMALQEHYELDEQGRPMSIKDSTRPFSMDDIKTCATCRGYGRLVRRALLDESTKKFILYLNREYVPLEEELARQVKLMQEKTEGANRKGPVWPDHLQLEGSIQQNVKTMTEVVHHTSPGRWKDITKLRDKVVAYRKRVALDEQPYDRVRSMVESTKRRKKTDGDFEFDNTILQSKGVLLATALNLRFDIALLTDFLAVKDRASSQTGNITISFNLQDARDECATLINLADTSGRIRQQAEGYTFLAHLHALERSQTLSPQAAETHLGEGREAAAHARSLCAQHPTQTRGLLPDIETVDRMLRDSTFYAVVTNEERMAVVAAMAREFHGTGHWYYCRNGHPFTIGECGGAMEQTACPEEHRVAEGVMRADDLEASFEGMHL
ncbi:putative NF-X1 finger and helicase domain protein [Aspergillus novofumigatus IBT 16806]|uniref:Putative NF-X1 finger and helicase protein n=1 Tax=Aspergillus novofumigatus (strain IBT 16806) TaxID=1392255 RepID=A0A2I1CLE9_ASPN1|nr:putative NF-X1 finger and helicase protein [Aspergillus novofumigatus IBT 16806]PKX98448.1 putative NF-X1 finger and helicase protein [Aspergillus novofumigatus IBT 16806]